MRTERAGRARRIVRDASFRADEVSACQYAAAAVKLHVVRVCKCPWCVSQGTAMGSWPPTTHGTCGQRGGIGINCP